MFANLIKLDSVQATTIYLTQVKQKLICYHVDVVCGLC